MKFFDFFKKSVKPETVAVVEEVEVLVDKTELINRLETVKSKLEQKADPEEVIVEKWWISQNKPSSVNHYELVYSGINMDRFSNLEAQVGKFKFTRQYFSGDWTIEILN